MSATLSPAPTISNHGGKVNWRLAYEREAVALDDFTSVPATTSPLELPLSASRSAADAVDGSIDRHMGAKDVGCG
jgi:hypothetical protein